MRTFIVDITPYCGSTPIGQTLSRLAVVPPWEGEKEACERAVRDYPSYYVVSACREMLAFSTPSNSPHTMPV